MYKLVKKLENGVRVGELSTPHGVIHTPFFMPVGTVGSVKGVSPKELEEMGAEIVLSNTYHLYLRPGEQLVKQLGGLHQFMRWPHPILTDSGGYQVFSLAKNNFQFSISNFQSNPNNRKTKNIEDENSLKISPKGSQCKKLKIENSKKSLVEITEEGVIFKSHLDGSKHLFTPEKVIQIQLDLGVDILMPLDVCPSGKASREEIKCATEITIRWAERAKRYFDQKMNEREEITNSKCQISNKKLNIKGSNEKEKDSTLEIGNLTLSSDALRPMLHGIVQGGMDLDLRKDCAERLIELDFDGYSVGGLAVDLETRDMWDVVKLMGEILPENKQRYLMGVGTPDDIIQATKLGMDMFDCVLPTRMARHANVYVRKNQISNIKNQNDNSKCKNGAPAPSESIEKYRLTNLLNSQYRTDPEVIDKECGCYACSGEFSKAYISHLLRSGEILGIRLATLHNLFQYLELMRNLREGLVDSK